MPLTGTYQRTLDEKFRLAVPKRLREQFSGKTPTSLYVAPGTERSLAVYSPSAFEKLADRLEQRTTNPAEVRNYLRLFYARAEQVPIDAQGRIRIPERLVEYAQIAHDVVLLGVHDHAEIWKRQLWEQFFNEHISEFDTMATQAFQGMPRQAER